MVETHPHTSFLKDLMINLCWIEYNEAYELKLKYKNKLVNQDFKYIQSSKGQHIQQTLAQTEYKTIKKNNK